MIEKDKALENAPAQGIQEKRSTFGWSIGHVLKRYTTPKKIVRPKSTIRKAK